MTSLDDHRFFGDMLDTAVYDMITKLEINDYIAREIGLRDLIRTVYAAANNARAISEHDDFAKAIFLACCREAQIETIKRLGRQGGYLDIMMRLHMNDINPFIEVIGDLFND